MAYCNDCEFLKENGHIYQCEQKGYTSVVKSTVDNNKAPNWCPINKEADKEKEKESQKTQKKCSQLEKLRNYKSKGGFNRASKKKVNLEALKNKSILTVIEAAVELSASESYVREHIHSGEITAYTLYRGGFRIKKEDLFKFLENKKFIPKERIENG